MKLVTFKGRELILSREQAEKIVDSGLTNLIAIEINGSTEYVNGNDIAGIYNDSEPTEKIEQDHRLNQAPRASEETRKKIRAKLQDSGIL